MAKKVCGSCDSPISKKDKQCANCGVKLEKKVGFLGKLFKWAFYSLCAVFVLGIMVANKKSETETESRTPSNDKNITRADYGDKWPFTVDEGLLKCVPASVVTFEAGGSSYAVNGLATSSGFADIDPIWAYNDELNQEMADALKLSLDEYAKSGTMLRVNIGSVLDDGLKLCE